MPEFTSHYSELQRIAAARESLYGGEIMVATIPSLMERKDGGSVFEEGFAFAGVESKEGAEAYITAAASPHIRPCIPKSRLLGASEEVLGVTPVLPPGMETVGTVTPQMVIWWRDGRHEGFADMIYIAGLEEERKQDFCDVIERQTTKAVRIISNVSAKPTIWGSWGHGSPGERALSGRNRGAPTNGHGHLHVIDFSAETPINDLEPNMGVSEKLNHYEPWATLVYKIFSNDIARALENGLKGVKVAPFSEIIENNQHIGTINNGYELRFDKPVPYSEAIGTIIEIAGRMEVFYQAMAESHAVYYMYQSRPRIAELVRESIASQAVHAGFSSEGASNLVDFILKIRPTYSQIVTWIRELEKESKNEVDIRRLVSLRDRYDRARKALFAPLRSGSFGLAMVKDTVAHSSDIRLAGRVWPEHLGSTYIIDYELVQDGIYVNRIKLIPAVDSTESAPEHITGRVLRRAVG